MVKESENRCTNECTHFLYGAVRQSATVVFTRFLTELFLLWVLGGLKSEVVAKHHLILSEQAWPLHTLLFVLLFGPVASFPNTFENVAGDAVAVHEAAFHPRDTYHGPFDCPTSSCLQRKED